MYRNRDWNTSTLVVYILLLGVAVWLCSCQKPIVKLDPSPKLTELQVSCSQSSIPKNIYFPCEAIGVYSNGSTRNLTFEAVWESANTGIVNATLATNPNWMRGIAPGTTEVSATVGGITGTFRATVTSATPVSVAVAPSNQVFRVGLQQQFTSISVFSDGNFFDVTTSSSWVSLDPTVASVSTSTSNMGLVTAQNVGSTNIQATFDGVLGSTGISILNKTLLAIQVGPTTSTVIQGLTSSFTCTGIHTDLTTIDLTANSTWSVTDGTVASISNGVGTAGVLSALVTGATTIRASYGGFSATASVTVTSPTLLSISLTPANSSLANGLTQQLTATGHYSDGTTVNISEFVTWTTSNGTFATVNNTAGLRGRVTAHALGTATITATKGAISGNTDVTVTAAILSSIALTPSTPSVPLGTSQALTATGTYSDGTTADLTATATWSSSNTSRATVSDSIGTKGLVSSVALGATTISAVASGVTGQTVVSVIAPILSLITVTPAAQSIAKGLTVQYTATGTYSDGSTADITSSVTWGSADTLVVTISNAAGSRGLATGAGIGTTNVTATLSSVMGQTSLQITAALLVSIAVTPANSTIVLFQTLQFTATGTYTDGSTVNLTNSVTWGSSNGATASISNVAGTRGLASGLGLSTTTITATLGGVSGNTQLNGIL